MFVSIRARPAPGVYRTAQGKPESIHPNHDLRSANNVDALAAAQDFPGEFGVNGKKLSCCH
ncbi:MAG: hypothetical protein JST28_10360 [Acidobacteria bacterium]|nr:hypothetical protein [Acidobacteriota bacterium]